MNGEFELAIWGYGSMVGGRRGRSGVGGLGGDCASIFVFFFLFLFCHLGGGVESEKRTGDEGLWRQGACNALIMGKVLYKSCRNRKVV